MQQESEIPPGSGQSGGTERLIQGYAPPRGVPDELIGPDGKVREVWRDFIGHLGSLPTAELSMRTARGDQYLRDAGVFFRHADMGAQAERQWPLSHIPVLINASEWDELTDGLAQRADLLEALMRDLYGENRLIAEGRLPAELIVQNSEWARPLVGVVPPSGRYLNFVAFELGRAPDGRWWVLNDRTQAPSGAGFALENRVATARIFSDLYARSNVRRLAGFFRLFQESLTGLCQDDGQAAILSPGALSDTYWEHAYIARYLGLLLLEGEDLTIEQGRTMVRTVSGLKPVSVLWRRLDTRFADPLELDDDSRIGVPGLVQAARQQSVSIVNALGSGVLETRALFSFMPQIARTLLKEPLKLPNVATWWCGQKTEHDHVEANLEAMTLSHAMSTRLPVEAEDHPELHADALRALLKTSPEQVVGQEQVTLSTSPALEKGRLVARPMSLRVFMVRTRFGWKAMPGGYARIGNESGTTRFAMHRGGHVADVWVVDDKPVAPETLIRADSPPRRPEGPDLPSRAAENLYWLGRYLDRAENTLRLARAYDLRRDEAGSTATPLLRFIADHMLWLGLSPQTGGKTGLALAAASAAQCARRVRDRLSPDGWMAVAELERLTSSPRVSRISRTELLRQMASFTGLAHENMYRGLPWRFITIGRALERAISNAALLAHFADERSPEGAYEVALECCDSLLSHRNMHGFVISRTSVVSLLGCDVQNPRSIHAELVEIDMHMRALPRASDTVAGPNPFQLIAALCDEFSMLPPDRLDSARLSKLRHELAAVSDGLTAACMT